MVTGLGFAWVVHGMHPGLTDREVFLWEGGREGVLPYMAYTGTCCHIGYGEGVDRGKVRGIFSKWVCK